MATNLNTIKNWFKTGLKPTQSQFWATWDSFWHKDEAIPQSSISNLTTVLNAKAEKSQFDAHKTDTNAHAGLFNLKEDKINKGAPGGYAPLDGFGKIVSDYLNMVDDLITGGSNPLTAEQGKIIQIQLDAINLAIGTDDIDLDTLQEIVDKIKEIQEGLDAFLVNDLTTGGTTKALTAEMGKVLAARVALLEVTPIAEDFYIATLIDSTKLLYKTDTFREIDLQPFVGTAITNTNEIVRNGNDIFVVGNYSYDNSLTAFIVSLINCRIRNNVLVFDSSKYAVFPAPIHGLIFHNGFLYSATRTTTTNIAKINPYDFTDIRTLSLPNDATYGGQTTDILGYKDKLYVLVTADWYQTSKFVEISDNLTQYRNVFNIPFNAAYWTAPTSPFLIYCDEVYIPFLLAGDLMAMRVYDLQGNLRRERTNIPFVSIVSGSTYAVPHWMGIFNNKLLITNVYRKSLLRLDCTTLASEEAIALPSAITDDNSITRDGYLILNGEYNIYDTTAPAQLIKVKYNNFADYTVLLQGAAYNNGKGSYGSINNKINTNGLNLLEKKDNYLTKTADYQILMNDFPNNNCLVIFCNASGGSLTITLPAAAASPGYEVRVVKTDVSANTVTVRGSGAELINASNTQVLAAQYDKINIRSNGAQNFII
ncbi:hypothetical protein J0383_07740 [Flavobacterium endoglycinae]|uniref:Tail fiber protein n=1 Tax=Flavobacterium endoglycinae TaxID=2816357 RepID=A0ABX7QHY2_9FLAO|nr:hypothetical protein [Flavobacterium endoglycinae]QSW90690.1 hypothetical protein J0383_07740 [Flavobacterium endoglycinae]